MEILQLYVLGGFLIQIIELTPLLTNTPRCECVADGTACKTVVSGVDNSMMKDCFANQQLCCDENQLSTSNDEEDTVYINPNNESKIKPRVRIHFISMEDSLINEESNPSTGRQFTGDIAFEPIQEKPKEKCTCKSRESCSEKNTDYTFGFHCNHNEVYCCEPIDPALMLNWESSSIKYPESTTEEELAENYEKSVDNNANNEIQIIPSCYCIKLEDECLESTSNMIDQVKYELIRSVCNYNHEKPCCNNEIKRKNDEQEQFMYESYQNDPNSKNYEDLAEIEEIDETSEIEGIGIDVNGQPAFRQPIQLPFRKIPFSENNGKYTVKTNSEIGNPQLSRHSLTIVRDDGGISSPPELPTHYHKNVQFPSGEIHRNIPYSNNVLLRKPVSEYYGNMGPHFIYNPPPVVPLPTNLQNTNNRLLASERTDSSSKGNGFLDRILSFFRG